VVDVDCNKHETYRFDAVVISPTRGRVDFLAAARLTTAALSKVQRAGYGTFALAGTGPWAGPPTLSVDMSYDEIAGYEDQRSHYLPGTCALETGNPQALCSRNSQWHPADWASANASFLQDPPQDWYRLVRTLVALRAPSYAATDLGNASLAQLSAWAAAVGFQNGIDVADVVPDLGAPYLTPSPYRAQPGQLTAAVGTPDGGMAYAGTRGAQIVVARTDRKGARLWESVLTEPGIQKEESASLVACDGGFYVHGKGVVDTAPWRSPTVDNLWAHHRVLKMDSRGKVLWKWYPPRRPPPAQIPQFFRGQLTPQGTLLIDGYIQLDNNGPLHGWTAEVSPAGKTLRDEVGSIEQGDRNSKP
jgi:hypothetical protein